MSRDKPEITRYKTLYAPPSRWERIQLWWMMRNLGPTRDSLAECKSSPMQVPIDRRKEIVIERSRYDAESGKTETESSIIKLWPYGERS